MKKLSVRITVIIDLVSIITLAIQFGLYFVANSFALTVGISCILLLLFSHILLIISQNYESIFLHSFILVLLSSCMIGFIYMKGDDYALTFQSNLLSLILLNWFIPFLYSTVRFLHDSRQRFSGYGSYFRMSSIQFLIYYVGFISLLVLIKPIQLDYTVNSMDPINFIPFYHSASYLEDYVYNHIDLQPFVLYLSSAIALYIPYGFYIRLLFKNAGHLLLTGMQLLLPMLVEISQYNFTTQSFDIEHILLGFLGGVIGATFFAILNRSCLSLRNYEFLEGRLDL